MSKIRNILILLGVILSFASCSKDSDSPATNPLSIVTKSIAEGEEVNSSVTKITLTYSAAVEINSSNSITLNGTKLTPSVSNMVVTIPLSLEKGEEYTLSIPANTILSKENNSVSAPALNLHFNTEAKVVTNIAPLTNSNATKEAQNLYNFLKENYGNKIISGAMGSTDWGLSYSDYINQITGKYPAVVGYDYMHLAWGIQNWIDYSDITPVKTHWDNNGIVVINWHWCVPSTEGETDPSKMAFYLPGSNAGSEGTTFDIRNALTAGTWENKVILNDIEKLAGYMKLLADANIPVIFRPLHEAAGDYSWGAWFWWGKYGVKYTKELYILLHDKLVNDYNLNNIIWAWTMQTSDKGVIATASKLIEAYPGDDYVDIVGADLYYGTKGSQEGSHKAEYELVKTAVNGKKIVALQEVGNIFDPEQCMTNGDSWSWFMSWVDADFATWNSPAIWKYVMTNSNVITRADMPSLK